MWIILVGGLMITLPATVVILFSLGRVAMLPAAASLAINMIPFLAAWLLTRKAVKDGDVDLGH